MLYALFPVLLFQMESNLQGKVSDHLHFRHASAVETLTYGEMQRIAFITLEFARVTLEWAFAAVENLVSG